MSEPQWSIEKPSEPGYYWMRTNERGIAPRVVYLWGCADELCVAFPGNDQDCYLSELEAEWAGPIEPPK